MVRDQLLIQKDKKHFNPHRKRQTYMDNSSPTGKRFPSLSYTELANRMEPRIRARKIFFKRRHYHYSGWEMAEDWDVKLREEEDVRRSLAMADTQLPDYKTYRIGNSMQERLRAASLRELSDTPNKPRLRKCLLPMKPASSSSAHEKKKSDKMDGEPKTDERMGVVTSITNNLAQMSSKEVMIAYKAVKMANKEKSNADQEHKKSDKNYKKADDKVKKIDDKVKTIDDKVKTIDDKVTKIDDKVKPTHYELTKSDERVIKTDTKLQKADEERKETDASAKGKMKENKPKKCWRYRESPLYLPVIFTWEEMKTTTGYPSLKATNTNIC